MKIKQQLLDLCNLHIQKRINDYKNEVSLIKDAIESNEDSSDDEDDSGNGKLLNDLEKNMQYLNDAHHTLEQLKQVRPNIVSDTAGLGSLITTDSITFFIAISMGKVDLDTQEIYIISMASPIGQLLRQKKKGESFQFNGKVYHILNVE